MVRKMKVKLLAALPSLIGIKEVEVEANSWKEAIKKLINKYEKLKEVLSEDGTPKPGYMMFINGVDYRLYEKSDAEEIVILPVIHGGGEDVEIVEWKMIDEGANIIANKAKTDNFIPDIIVGILRGGVIPARLVADKLGVHDITTMEIKLYKGPGIRGEKPFLRQPPLLPLTGKKVLIVDDVSDSGLTLQLAVEAVNLYLPEEIRTASIYIKPWTKFVPDYYAYTVESWIVFPWERGEFERGE